MGTMGVNVASTATYLSNYGEGVLTRLHFARALLHPANRSEYLSVQNPQFGKIIKECAKAFPGEPKQIETVVGYDAIKAKDSAIRAELQPIYEAVLAAIDYSATVMKLFERITEIQVPLQMTNNPLLTTAALECMSMLVQSREMTRTLLSLDVVSAVTVHNLTVKIMEHNPHPDFSAVCQFLIDVEKKIGVKQLHTMFEPFAGTIGDAVMDMFPHLINVLNTAMFPKQGLLNPLHSPELMIFPLPTETYSFNMIKDKMEKWICLGFLVCPSALTRPGALDALKVALSQQFTLGVFREMCMDIHDLFDYTFEKYSNPDKSALKLNKKKQKVYVEEAALLAVTSNLSQRQERRTYLVHEIGNMVNIFKDSKGLLGPKAEQVLCCLSMVRQEVEWFFRHISTPPPTSHKANKKFHADLLQDPLLPVLIDRSVKLVAIVEQNYNIVQEYYVELMTGLDTTSFTEAERSISQDIHDPTYAPSEARAVMDQIKNEMKTLNETKGKGQDVPSLINLRGMVLGLQGLLSTPADGGDTVYSGAMSKINNAVMTLMVHSRLVDDWQELMRSHISLGHVFFYQKLHLTMLRQSMQGTDEVPASCLSLVKVVGQSMYHVHPHCPLEHANLGMQCEAVARTFIGEVKNKINDAFIEIFNQFYKLDVAELQPKLSVADRNTRNFNVKPGTESYGSRRLENPIWGWAHKQNYLMRVISECEQTPHIDIHSVRLHPKEHVRQVIQERVYHFLRSRVPQHATITSPPIIRPTEFVAQLNNLVRVCNTVCSYINLDFDTILRDALLREIVDPNVGVFGMRSKQTPVAPAAGDTRPLIQLIAEWMLHFVENQMGDSYIDSDWRGCLITNHGDPNGFRAEQYLDNQELDALVTVVGSYGVLHIDKKMMQALAKHVVDIKEHLSACQHELESLSRGFAASKKGSLIKESQKLCTKGLNIVISRMISVGKILIFRQRLFAKLHTVLTQRTPVIINAVTTIRTSYHEGASRDPAVTAAEYMARSAGLESDGIIDALLLQALAPFMDDATLKLWQLLPVAMAVSFTGQFWRYQNPKYNMVTGSHLDNADCLLKALTTFTTAFAPQPVQLVPSNPIGATAEERDYLETFVRIGSYMALKLRMNPETESQYNTNDMIIFLDKTVASSRALHSVPLDMYLPNTLVMSIYNNYNAGMSSSMDDLAVERGSRVQPTD